MAPEDVIPAGTRLKSRNFSKGCRVEVTTLARLNSCYQLFEDHIVEKKNETLILNVWEPYVHPNRAPPRVRQMSRYVYKQTYHLRQFARVAVFRTSTGSISPSAYVLERHDRGRLCHERPIRSSSHRPYLHSMSPRGTSQSLRDFASSTTSVTVSPYNHPVFPLDSVAESRSILQNDAISVRSSVLDAAIQSIARNNDQDQSRTNDASIYAWAVAGCILGSEDQSSNYSSYASSPY